jgi:hypothetical protein
MPSSEQAAARRSLPVHTRPLTYWQCRRLIGWLKRFQGLVIHREKWGIYMQDAAPIEELLPGVDENERWRIIDREINRLVPLVSFALNRIYISTQVTLTDYASEVKEGQLAKKQINRTYSLIDNYFELPRGNRRQDCFRLLMQALERGVGGLEEEKRTAVRMAFSPISWLAWVVEIPIRVLERAGVPMEDASSKGVHAIGWVLRLGMFIVVAFVAAKLGLSVPWEKLFSFLK